MADASDTGMELSVDSDDSFGGEAYELVGWDGEAMEAPAQEDGDILAPVAESGDVSDVDPVAAAPAKPKSEVAAAVEAVAQQTQLALQAMQLQMQQQNQQFMQVLQQLAQGNAPAQQLEPDPLEALDPNDPDFYFKQLEIKNQKLEQRLAKFEGKLTQAEQERQAQLESAKQQKQWEEMSNWRDGNVTKGVEYLFKGFPNSPQVDEAKDTVAALFDSQWRRLSSERYNTEYHVDAYGEAVAAVQKRMKLYDGLRARPTTAARQPQNTAGANGAPRVQQPQSLGPYKSYWDRK
jgi:hypothetical protein